MKRVYLPVVEIITEPTFYFLLSHDKITEEEKKIINSLYKSQKTHHILTKRKYALFWTIYGKYFELPEFRYREYEKYKINKNPKLVRNVIFAGRK